MFLLQQISQFINPVGTTSYKRSRTIHVTGTHGTPTGLQSHHIFPLDEWIVPVPEGAIFLLSYSNTRVLGTQQDQHKKLPLSWIEPN